MSDTVTLPANLFWGALGLAGLLIACGLVVLALNHVRPGKADLGARAFVEALGLSTLPGLLTFLIALLWLALFVSFIAGVGWTLIDIIGRLDHQDTDLRWSLLALAAMMAALSAVIAFPLTLLRTQFNRRQTHAQEQDLITDRINKAVEGLGAEKLVKRQRKSSRGKLLYEDDYAGNTNLKKPIFDEMTVPNIEVRIGAIHALARIARENLNFHVQVMEILCAYVRENSPADSALPLHLDEMPADNAENPAEAWKTWIEGGVDEDGDQIDGLQSTLKEFRSRIVTRTDIQTALTALGHRTPAQLAREAGAPDPERDGDFVFATPFPEPPEYPEKATPAAQAEFVATLDSYRSQLVNQKEYFTRYTGYRLDLRRTNLQGYDLHDLDLRGAQFEGAKIEVADLSTTKMQGADLLGSRVQGTDLEGAQMQGANLRLAMMQGADLMGAFMQGANLTDASLQGAFLGVARVQGANLVDARMQGAVLIGTRMQMASLGRASLQSADLMGARIQGANLRSASMQGVLLIEAMMDDTTQLQQATLNGAAVRSVDDATIAQLRPFWDVIFADGTVQLPEGEKRPNWPKEDLEFFPWEEENSPFHIEWRRWQQLGPEAYTPPPPGQYDKTLPIR